MPRCCINVFDKLTHKTRKCLHNRKWGLICSFHARSYIVKIQAAWRTYKTKKKINIYKNLPSDLWGLVLGCIQQKNNIYKLYKSHAAIYQKRVNTLENLPWRSFSVTVIGGRPFTINEHTLLLIMLDESKKNLKYFNKLLMK